MLLLYPYCRNAPGCQKLLYPDAEKEALPVARCSAQGKGEREKPLPVQGGPVPNCGVPPQWTGTIHYCGRTTTGTVRELQPQYGGFRPAFNHLVGTPYVRILYYNISGNIIILVAITGMSYVWCLRKDVTIVSITEKNRIRHMSVIFQPILRKTW